MSAERDRAIERIREWAQALPPEWRAVAEWQIETDRLDLGYIESTDPAFLLDWEIDRTTIAWLFFCAHVRDKDIPIPPVPDWLAAKIAEDSTTPAVTPEVAPEVAPQVTPAVRQPIAPEPLPSVEKALEIVHGAREQEYGHPADDLQCIADMWTMFLTRRHTPVTKGSPLEPDEVCLMMDLLKAARKMRSPGHNDSWVDDVGYVVCRDRIVNRLGTYEERVAKWPVNREAAR